MTLANVAGVLPRAAGDVDLLARDVDLRGRRLRLQIVTSGSPNLASAKGLTASTRNAASKFIPLTSSVPAVMRLLTPIT